MSTKVCKTCNKAVVRVFKELNNQGFTVYVDGEGRRWQGKVCPDCYNDKAKKHMKALRSKE